MAVTDFLEPTTVAEACDLLAADPYGTKAIAGGTAVTLMLRQGLIAPDRLVSLARIPGFAGIDMNDGAIRIGAGTTLTTIAASPLVREHLPSLAEAAGRVGNVRVRNVATLGGNLAEADYASDPPAVLVSLGAACDVQGPGGRRRLPAEDFVTGFYSTALEPGELLTDLVVPAPADRHAVYLKYVSRSSEDRPCVGVAARVDLRGGVVGELDVVVGAVASRPQRLPELTRTAAGRPLDDATIAAIADGYRAGVEPMGDPRGSSWYRGEMIAVFVRRALATLAQTAREAQDG